MHVDNQYLILSALDAIHDGVVITDHTSRIVYANPAYQRILGVRLDKIIGQKVSEIEPTASLLTVLETGKPILQERTRVESLNMDIVSTITPIFKNGTILGTVAIFKNVTEAMQLTRALQRMEGLADYLRQELERKTQELPRSFDQIVGRNETFVESLKLAAKAAKSDSNVMIRGENGVGKEVIAKAIHAASHVCHGPMIRVNCSAIPENLLESELFGYEEGAFTGAKRGGKIGKFELAHSGTLFLDEVGDMSAMMQAKLLRVIQDKEFERVGGTQSVKVDVRIISATNRNLEKMVQEGTFREDLYYRLNVVPIFVPPLRERKDDLLLLMDHFLAQQNERNGKHYVVSEEVLQVFYRHEWPGNIRELQNAVEYSTVMCAGEVVTPEHLPPYFSSIDRTPERSDVQSSIGEGQFDCESDDKVVEKVPFPGEVPTLRDRVEEVERETILMALRATRYNKTEAMKLLGISRQTLYRKMEQLGIED